MSRIRFIDYHPRSRLGYAVGMLTAVIILTLLTLLVATEPAEIT
jgi:hypothetical protein